MRTDPASDCRNGSAEKARVSGRWIAVGLSVGLVWGVGACEEETPTAISPDLFPIDPQTVEVTLSWDDFATGLQVYGGFGSPPELGYGVVANGFDGVLDARVIVRPSGYPVTAGVADTAGVVRQDSSLVFIGGRVVVLFDTLSGVPPDPVDFSIHAVTQPWDPRTATWTAAVDSIAAQTLWGEPGGGPAVQVGEGTWDPTTGDSLVVPVDSATLALWSDPMDLSRGVRVDLETEGLRIDVLDLHLRLDTRPGSRPDTVIVLNSAPEIFTFLYDPFPEPPPDGIRVGGVPAWRTVLDLEIPAVLNGPPELCERVKCPLSLVAERINAASLLLRTRVSEPGFQPRDTVLVDVRPVLAPDHLPKSPLGNSFVGGIGERVGPEAFGEEPDQLFAVPLTGFVRDYLRGETAQGMDPPSSIMLLSFLEPFSMGFANFSGPGSEGEPLLRLIVTTPDTVNIR